MVFLATAKSVGIISIVKNKTVKSFWEGNPFTYKGDQGVGYVQVDSMTLEVFDKIERKLRKHGSHYQAEGALQPLEHINGFTPRCMRKLRLKSGLKLDLFATRWFQYNELLLGE